MKKNSGIKLLWISLIIFDALLLCFGFLNSNLLYSIGSLMLAFWIKNKSYDLLFKSFDENWDKRHLEFKKKRGTIKNEKI